MNEAVCRDSVLVVDDDADFRALIDAIAHVCGVPVLQAADCLQALEVLEREHSRIKMVFLDYFMPGMTPARCAAAIIAKAGPSVPVVLLTAAADPSARAEELKLDRWIAKPIEPSALRLVLTHGCPPGTAWNQGLFL